MDTSAQDYGDDRSDAQSFYSEEHGSEADSRDYNVLAMAKNFDEGIASFKEIAEAKSEAAEEGKALLTSVLKNAQDLRGRCVGRNYDDANEIFDGVQQLLEHWETREEELEGLKIDTLRIAVDYKQARAAMEDEMEAVEMRAQERVDAVEAALEEAEQGKEVALEELAALKELHANQIQTLQADLELQRTQGELRLAEAREAAEEAQQQAREQHTQDLNQALDQERSQAAQAASKAAERQADLESQLAEQSTLFQSRVSEERARMDSKHDTTVRRLEEKVAELQEQLEQVAIKNEETEQSEMEHNARVEEAVRSTEARVSAAANAKAASELAEVKAEVEAAVREAREGGRQEAEAQAQVIIQELNTKLKQVQERAEQDREDSLAQLSNKDAEAELQATIQELNVKLKQVQERAEQDREEASAQLAREVEAAEKRVTMTYEERSANDISQASQEAAAFIRQKEAEMEDLLTLERSRAQQAISRAETAEAEIIHAKRIQTLHSSSDMARTAAELSRCKQELEQTKLDLATKTKDCKNLKSQVDGLHALTANLPSGLQFPVALSITGDTQLGSTLHLKGPTGTIDPKTHTQWYRVTPEGETQIIAGANRVQYAPEPRDVGATLGCSLSPQEDGGALLTAYSSGPITAGDTLLSYVDNLTAKGTGEFGVVIVQYNGKNADKRMVHQLQILSNRLKIQHKGKTMYKAAYTLAMQVCGARGGGDAAAQGLFLALDPTQVFMLAFQSARERNAAIMLIRRFAQHNAVDLVGPEESSPSKLENFSSGSSIASGSMRNRV